jgi:hypothetical protein
MGLVLKSLVRKMAAKLHRPKEFVKRKLNESGL